MKLDELRPEVRARACTGYALCNATNSSGCLSDYAELVTSELQILHHSDRHADPCLLAPESVHCTQYTRLAIGRDPLSRLFSGFRNKLDECSTLNPDKSPAAVEAIFRDTCTRSAGSTLQDAADCTRPEGWSS